AEQKYENTIKSIEKAIAEGIKVVEVDVRVTKDGVPVLIHDDRVDRITNGKGYVKDKTLEEIRALKVRGDGEIPTLQQALDVAKGKCKLLIELKTADSLKPVCALVKKKGMVNSVIIMSFAHILVKYAKKLANVKTAIPVVALTLNPMRMMKETGASIIMIYHETLLAANSISKKLIEKMHRKKIGVFVFPVDEKKVYTKDEGAKFVVFKVDAIVANDPLKIRTMLEEMKNG
ncbi:glycerophosphodiester phosphodiesterase family protein, partial [Candidatus Woesearchaeota archaeon]|nr:glycerophosphodiester phosphodiesterase family protein [Candidatus Woesearchaeota archaeon]